VVRLPFWHTVSFTVIARKHIKYLRRYLRVEEIDELAFPHIMPFSRPLVVFHPLFYQLMRHGRYLERNMGRFGGIVGFDVADSDRISKFAVSLTDYVEAVIVPSEWSRRAYLRSGVKVPVYVVPHGVERDWITAPRQVGVTFRELWRLKTERRKKLLLFICLHSEWRKGVDLVLEVWDRLRHERRDVQLVIRTMTPDGPLQQVARRKGAVIVSGWYTERQYRELFDTCDVYLLFSRGGGFEAIGLDALTRGEVVLAARGGAWQEYLPPEFLIESRPSDVVLRDNPIHVGIGVEVVVEKAVDKIHDVLENLDEYRARAREHVEKVIKHRFVWDVIGRQIAEILRRYLNYSR